MLARSSSAAGSQSSESGRLFLQERLHTMCGVLLVAFLALLTAANVGYVVDPATRPPNLPLLNLLSGLGWCIFLAIWALTHPRRQASERVLRACDWQIAILTGANFGAQSALTYEYNLLAPLVMLLYAVFTISMRAAIVPSSARRTFVLSASAFALWYAGQTVAVLAHPDLYFYKPSVVMVLAFILCAVATAIATTTSQALYGLRREVAAARKLGQYTLQEKIGEGGMGAVYRASHAMLRRPTAIKLLPEEKAGANSLERFEREVQLTAELSHPNVIEVYDFGRSPEGVFYYAMEYLDGIDLETLVERYGPLPAARVCYILGQAADGLTEAHARRLVHRDIKPANIILSQMGTRFDVVKVLDFGLVKDLEAPDGLTGVNAIAGTPHYLSPEALASPDDIGPMSNLYALGAVAYFLLTGTRVFPAETLAGVYGQHMLKVPEPPSSRTDLPIPAALDALVLRCLEKKPEDRPSSARALRDALHLLDVGAWTQQAAAAWWGGRETASTSLPRPAHSPQVMSVDFSGRA